MMILGPKHVEALLMCKFYICAVVGIIIVLTQQHARCNNENNHYPSWEANSSSTSRDIPRILWNPCSQDPVTCTCLVPDPLPTVCLGPRLSVPLRFRDMLSFLAPRCKTSFVGCSRLLIQYILTHPSHLEAISFICLPEDMPCLGEIWKRCCFPLQS